MGLGKSFITLPALAAALAIATAPVAHAKAVYGAWGFPLEDMDPGVKPGDDFYNYANGGWQARAVIAPDRSSAGDTIDIIDRTEADLHQVAEESQKAEPGSTARKVGDFYFSFTDEAGIEARGIEPVKAYLAPIDAIATPADLAAFFGSVMIGQAPFALYVYPDDKDPLHYAGFIYQGGLGLPDRTYYLEDTEENLRYRAAYKDYIKNLLTLGGIAEPDKKAETIYALELEIAKLHWPVEESRDAVKIYNPMTVDELVAQALGIDWPALIAAAQLTKAPRLVVGEKSAVIAIAKLTGETPLDTWKAYLTFHTLDAAAPFLPKAFDDAQFDFNGRVMLGREKQRDRWKRALRYIDTYMGEAMGQSYVAKRFPPSSKAMMGKMVANLKTALGQLIDEAAWLDGTTKTAAHKKLDTMGVMIGYPDTWRDYTKLEIKPDDILGNIARGTAFEWTRNTDRIAEPVDKTEFEMTPSTVNSYNAFSKNQIVFAAGNLQPPYFDPEADMAINYGSTGALIGHEISHGFDDQGRLYDDTGALRDWWTEKDGAAFAAEAAKVVAQFNGFEALPGLFVNGENVQGEAIADIAGLAIAYRAYHIALGGKEAPVLDGLTGDQRFFIGFAMHWRTKWRDDLLRSEVASDPHAPQYFRVIGTVQHFQPWYDAFGVKPGDKMYLDPEKRAKFW